MNERAAVNREASAPAVAEVPTTAADVAPGASLLDEIGQAMRSSEIAASQSALQSGGASLLWGDDVRPLSPDEIGQLKRQGNHAEDWQRLRVTRAFQAERVQGNRFYGDVVLGTFRESSLDVACGVALSAGVYDSTLRDVEVADDAVVYRAGMIARTLVGPRAAVVNTATVSCPEATTFGCGVALPVGIETGGRDIRTFAELTVAVAAGLVERAGDRPLRDEYDRLIDEYLDLVRGTRTIVGPGAIVRDTGQIDGCYIGPGAVVSNARRLSQCCLLSAVDEPTTVRDGACLQSAIVQWGAEVGSLSVVLEAVLCEHSHVDGHARVTKSILGPNSGVSSGEMTASLVGPFVGFHHQALLIAAIWPEGRGNVSAGANVGSNHTGKAPDQEIWCGEGTFFGLGVTVKFPANYRASPYSILAAGVTTLPQQVAFPFSLINTPSARYAELSGAINEIFPGWVLAENAYMLERCEAKFRQRNKARRESFSLQVFRPEIVAAMIDARERLAAAGGSPYYTVGEIRGLGKNFVTEEARLAGIAAYDLFLERYALRGLLAQLVNRKLTPASSAAARLLADTSDEPVWEQQRMILARRRAGRDVPALLKHLLAHEEQIARGIEASKEKDHSRGRRVIPDYDTVRSPVDEDPVVRAAWSRCGKLAVDVRQLLGE